MTKTWRRLLGLGSVALGLSALTAPVQAQCPNLPSGPPAGPDVIVGDLTGPANYSSSGGREALAVGTTSCNIGTVWLNWFSNTNQHPVIGASLYRFKIVGGAGRFEQMGQSWLKHGFFALSQNLCCSSCSSTNGEHLGVGCSDPYSASRNGSQSGLGPKYQVNAHTGAFTYPPPHPSGGNNGRVQVDIANLEVTSGSTTRYFAEAQYVTPDDAAAGNQNNNASRREVNVSGSGSAWTFSYTGGTTRQSPAIEAWPLCESGVTLVELNPTEATLRPSKLILGYKVTDLGGGNYHYEYALYNMNSDASVRSFHLATGANPNYSNVGFSDVDYLGGDGIGGTNYSGTDWPVTTTANSIEWATQTFGVNANANALRWGSTYGFRFDATSAPVMGTMTAELFKIAGQVQAQVPVPSDGVPVPGMSACPGDDTNPLGVACPCLNPGAIGHGCANSVNPLGALLTATGAVNPDTVQFQADGMPATVSCIYLQGDAFNSTGILFGDGVRCADGSLIRLRTKQNVGGASAYPEPGDPIVSVRGQVTPGSGVTRWYQTYYRNAAAAFCPPETFNVTNGWELVW